MKRSRFREQRIAFMLREADEGTPVVDICGTACISEASFHDWRRTIS